MRFVEIEGDHVRSVGGGPEYSILPPGAVEITTNADVLEGDIYKDGVFYHATVDELRAGARPGFNMERGRLFDITEWVRQRHIDRIELGINDTINWTTWLKYWQALRDMPGQPDFDPRNPVWPIQPV